MNVTTLDCLPRVPGFLDRAICACSVGVATVHRMAVPERGSTVPRTVLRGRAFTIVYDMLRESIGDRCHDLTMAVGFESGGRLWLHVGRRRRRCDVRHSYVQREHSDPPVARLPHVFTVFSQCVAGRRSRTVRS